MTEGVRERGEEYDVIVNRRLSIDDFRLHQISRPLGCVSPTSLCGGGGLRNRNAPFKGEPSVQRQRKEEEEATPLLP